MAPFDAVAALKRTLNATVIQQETIKAEAARLAAEREAELSKEAPGGSAR